LPNEKELRETNIIAAKQNLTAIKNDKEKYIKPLSNPLRYL